MPLKNQDWKWENFVYKSIDYRQLSTYIYKVDLTFSERLVYLSLGSSFIAHWYPLMKTMELVFDLDTSFQM